MTENSLDSETSEASAQELETVLLDVIAREGMVDREKLTPDATLESLGLVSVDVVNILLGIEDKFGIYIPVDGSIGETKNIGELMQVLVKLLSQKNHNN